MRALRLRPASYAPYALAILPALLAGAACHPPPFPPAQGARRGAPNLLPSVRRVPADAPAGSRAPSFGEAVLAAANARAATASTCVSGFADLEALRSAACSPTPAVAWDAFDETYAAAGRRASRRSENDAYDDEPANDPLRVPAGCAFGCVPSKPSDGSPLARVAAALPWGGKCFARPASGELVAPTSVDGTRAMSSSKGTLKPEKVALVAAVTNRIRDPSGREDVAAPARAYFGTSAFDGFPALIVDYRGQKRFGRFRDEVRHVGCGVWLGKTYLMDADDDKNDDKNDAETLAESLAAVGGVRLSPVVTAVIERAMPIREPGAPPPLVLDFALYATDEKDEREKPPRDFF